MIFRELFQNLSWYEIKSRSVFYTCSEWKSGQVIILCLLRPLRDPLYSHNRMVELSFWLTEIYNVVLHPTYHQKPLFDCIRPNIDKEFHQGIHIFFEFSAEQSLKEPCFVAIQVHVLWSDFLSVNDFYALSLSEIRFNQSVSFVCFLSFLWRVFPLHICSNLIVTLLDSSV